MANKNKKSNNSENPLVKIKNELVKRMDDVLIPKIYTPPNTEEAVVNARRKFYAVKQPQSFCQVQDSYKNKKQEDLAAKDPADIASQKQAVSSEQADAKPENQIAVMPKHELEKILNRSVLAEYRKELGLDKLKEFLEDKILEAASFETGIKMLYKHVKMKKRDLLDAITRQEVLPTLINAEIPFKEEVITVSEVYPDLTADEVALLALASPLNGMPWIFDAIQPFYYPPALVSMSIDGFDFAFGTIDERFEDDTKKTTSFKIGGITGIDTQTQHIYFDNNLTQAMRAMILLETNDQDIFNKLWKNEGINAFIRGDELLINAFLEGQKEKYGLTSMDEKTTCFQALIDCKGAQPRSDALESIRNQISSYYHSNNFRNSLLTNVCDFVKLLGLLKKVPDFITEQKKFDGYVMFYGTNVEFVDLQGKITSAPLLDYALHEVSFNIHGATIDTRRKNKLANRLFKKISKRVSDKNFDEKNEMAIDVVREQIYDDYEVYIPLDVTSRNVKMKSIEFMLKGFTDDEYIDRTVKFAYNELITIKELLGSMPKGFAKNVRSVVKKQDPRFFNIETFRTGEVRGGCFYATNGRIELSLPVDPPVMILVDKYNSYSALEKSKEKKQELSTAFDKSEMYNAMFQHIFMHEIAESIYPSINKEFKERWLELENIPADIAGKEDQYFLTNYSKKDPKEDFCETFAAYVVHGGDFKELASKHEQIGKKYKFMQDLFSIDGAKREFKNRTEIQLRHLHADPKKSFEEILQESAIRDTIKSDELASKERAEFAGMAMSYEDVADIITEHEEKGIKISKEEATQILQQRELESEQYEEELDVKRISIRLNNAAIVAVYKAGAPPDLGNHIPDIIFNQGEDGAIKYLIDNGATPEKAKECIDMLSGLYKWCPEAYEQLVTDPWDEIVKENPGVVKQYDALAKLITESEDVRDDRPDDEKECE